MRKKTQSADSWFFDSRFSYTNSLVDLHKAIVKHGCLSEYVRVQGKIEYPEYTVNELYAVIKKASKIFGWGVSYGYTFHWNDIIITSKFNKLSGNV
jgi:hypothetical protein